MNAFFDNYGAIIVSILIVCVIGLGFYFKGRKHDTTPVAPRKPSGRVIPIEHKDPMEGEVPTEDQIT